MLFNELPAQVRIPERVENDFHSLKDPKFVSGKGNGSNEEGESFKGMKAGGKTHQMV